jgi:DNA-binding SARP family transcriptional activator
VTFEAKTLVPLPGDPDAANGIFEAAADGSITLLEAPAEYALTEGLALAFSGLDRQPLWLRLGPEDSDPATFLLSLVAAARRLRRDAGTATLALMRAQPGPVFGWPPLFTQLARDLRLCMPRRGGLVLEDVHQASAGSPTLPMVGWYLLPELAESWPCVLVSHRGPQAASFDAYPRRSARELRISAPAVRRRLEEWAPELTGRARNRALSLIGGRAAILAGLRELAGTTCQGLEPLLERAASSDELVARTAEILLSGVGRESRGALGLAARIQYAHPAMTSVVTGEGQLPPGPWLQRLEEGWVRVRPCWRRPLATALGGQAMPGHDALHQSADWLLEAGAGEQAVVLYLEIGDHDCAARAIASQVGVLMDLGQWAMANRWLAQLPEKTFAAYPELNCCRADIAAVRGQMAAARRWFDSAASHYAKRHDLEGQCRSMLAGSTVAAEAGDLADALSRAHTASSLASADGMDASQMWASWQLGRISLAAGNSDGAISSFRRAAASAAAAGDSPAARPVRMAGDLAARIVELRRRQESHRKAQAALGHAEHEALRQLMTAVRAPALRQDVRFGTDGWSHTPAPLKLPGLSQSDATAPGSLVRSLSRLRRGLRARRTECEHERTWLAGAGESGPDPLAAGPPDPLMPSHPGPPAPDSPGPPAPDPPGLPVPDLPGLPVPDLPGSPGRPGAAAEPGPAVAAVRVSAAQAAHELAVHLLGPLHVAVDDVAIENWPSARCRSLFGYLLTHREPWPPREVLMETFWPESSPEAARNSLNVAIHGLRRTLRTITDTAVVVHVCGAYRINQELSLWLDVDEFDRRVESGHKAEETGDIAEARQDYELAGGVYRGDFMADDPYEDWTALTRERLRLAHLDALGRLSHLHFNAGHYTACASLCQRIVEKDPCREDAHRRLMRCYSRQGQPHLALMQYRMCVQALTGELGVEADPVTVELHQHIRRHQRV